MSTYNTGIFRTIPLIALVSLIDLYVQADARKRIVGAIEVVYIEKTNLSFTARVDTGAKTSSIHAENIKVDPSGKAEGKPISFDLVNKTGNPEKLKHGLPQSQHLRLQSDIIAGPGGPNSRGQA